MRILIPVDGSDNSLRAVEYVIGFLAEFKSEPQLLILNVQRSVAKGNVKLFINQKTIDDFHREQGMEALRNVRDVLGSAGLPYQYHISVGAPAEAIVQYAKEQGVDQIVMGRQGQGGMQSILLGSAVKKVLQLAECPVLLVK